jgi:hypothetical protein
MSEKKYTTRRYVGGYVAKYRKRGIFEKGPKYWGAQHRENKAGWCNPEVQSRAGRIGGKKASKICRDRKIGIFAPGAAARAGHAGGSAQRDKKIGIFAPGAAAHYARLRWADPVFREMMKARKRCSASSKA